MASFAVETLRLTDVRHHPNADRLDIAIVGPADTGYQVVVGRDAYKPGDLVAYIPEAAILPEWLIESLGLVGALSGSQHNRVKCVRLRGEVSQGLVWMPPKGWDTWFRTYYPEIPAQLDALKDAWIENHGVRLSYEGIDITQRLGITKYTPTLPGNMGGLMRTAPDWMRPTDSENIKKVGNVLQQGEAVYVSEKVHGTQMSIARSPEGTYYVSSKGVLGRGAVLEESESNTYWQCFHAQRLDLKLNALAQLYPDKPVQVIGEAYGSVQDLTYGNPTGPLKFLAFDIRVDGEFLDALDFLAAAASVELDTVPRLYIGPYAAEKILQLTDGKEAVSGKSLHIREGVVVKPLHERQARGCGRVSIKSVSADYLLRKGNTTEFE